jgi:hypothetical protein
MMRARMFLIGAVVAAATVAGAAERPRLETNERYIGEVSRQSDLDLSKLKDVFAFVLGSLPERVNVYPTENYYYFSFYADAVRYAGNIRLEIADKAEPELHFTYYEDFTDWNDDTPVQHVVLGKADGVGVEKLERLVYRVSYGGTSVVFALNDLSTVKPPAAAVAPGEQYIGPVFDESGVRFFLFFNEKLKLFAYVLDETVPVAERFFPLPRADRLLIGRRTGFAFYRDHLRERKLLVGVFEGNVRLNNYFDGPFDQLPDNFIEGEILRDAILAVAPELRGKIDRFGSEPSGDARYPIMPYLNYKRLDDLRVIDRCAAGRKAAPDYYACFSTNERTGQPMALGNRPPKSQRRAR